MTEIATATARPTYPHLENLDRVLVHRPDFLARAVTVSEKLHGWNARVGRDASGALWFGTRSQDFDLGSPDAPASQGFRDYCRETFGHLAPGVTLYGEWAGKGVQKGIDYGPQAFYLFAERTGLGPVLSSAAVLDQHWVDTGDGETYGTGFIAAGVWEGDDVVKRRPGVTTVPVIYEGANAVLEVLDGLRQGESIVAPGQPIEGIVIAPVEPIFNAYGGQVIAKFKSDRFSELTRATGARERKTVDTTRADGLAAEYVNPNRLQHVLDQVVEVNSEHVGQIVVTIDPLDVKWTGAVLRTMYEDVAREGKDDIEALDADDQRLVGKAVNKATLRLLAAARDEELRESMIIASQEGEDA